MVLAEISIKLIFSQKERKALCRFRLFKYILWFLTIVLGRISSRHIAWFSHINICVVIKQIRDKTISKVTGFSLRFLSSRSFFKDKWYSYLEIQYGQYGGQNVILCVLSCHRSKICQKDSPHQNVFKLTLSPKTSYVFRKDRQCKFIFLWSPSLDLINIIFVRALEAMKVAGETLQRNRRTSPAAGSYLQPWSKEMAAHESASEKTIWRLEIILRTIAIKRRARNIRKNFRTAPYFIMHAHTHLRSVALLRGHSMCWNEPATGPLGEKISASRFKLYF